MRGIRSSRKPEGFGDQVKPAEPEIPFILPSDKEWALPWSAL
jgi:hypothetical protein